MQFDSKGWGEGGEVTCDLLAVHKVGHLEYDLTASCQQIDAGAPDKTHSVLVLVSPTEIILDGERYSKCVKAKK